MGRRSPKEEKILDYIHQTKNAYGETDKGSRKAIRRRKAIVNRVFRRVGKDLARRTEREGTEFGEETDLAFKEQPRPDWEKTPDRALVERLTFGHRPTRRGSEVKEPSALQEEAKRRLKKVGRWPDSKP